MPTGPDVQIGDSDLDEREQRSQDFLRYPKAFSPAFDLASQPVRVIGRKQNSSHSAKKRPCVFAFREVQYKRAKRSCFLCT
jgi:hypothetical protein